MPPLDGWQCLVPNVCANQTEIKSSDERLNNALLQEISAISCSWSERQWAFDFKRWRRHWYYFCRIPYCSSREWYPWSHDKTLLSESKVKPFETTALAPSTLPRPLHISWATICLYSKKDKCWRQSNQWTCLQASKRDSQELCWKVKNRWQLTTVPCFMLPNRSSLAFFLGRPSS